MATTSYTLRLRGVKFTGSNSAEVLTLFADHAVQDNCTPTLKGVVGSVATWQHNPQGGPNEDLCYATVGRSVIMNGTNLFTYDATDTDIGYYLQTGDAFLIGAGGNSGQRLLAAKTAQIPAAVSLAAGTRSVAVVWPYTLPTASYAVDICPDTALSVGAPYTYAATNKTATGFDLTYTNSALILSLGAGTVDLYPRA